MNKNLLILSLGITLLGLVTIFSINPDGCWAYTNATDEGTSYFGKCYITKYQGSYEVTRECTGGFLGIGESCTIRDEPIQKSMIGEVCIIAKTGEYC